MGTLITEDEFAELLRSFRESAFHLETREFYAMTYERADFERFLAGQPLPPPELGWWRPWLDQIAELTLRGQADRAASASCRTRPATTSDGSCGRTPWHAAAGEEIRYMPRTPRPADRPAAGLRLVAARR